MERQMTLGGAASRRWGERVTITTMEDSLSCEQSNADQLMSQVSNKELIGVDCHLE